MVSPRLLRLLLLSPLALLVLLSVVNVSRRLMMGNDEAVEEAIVQDSIGSSLSSSPPSRAGTQRPTLVQDWRREVVRLRDVRLDVSRGVGALFIQPNWTQIKKELRNEPRIVVDFPFHRFTDDFGLIDVDLSEEELITALRDVTQTWAKANIFTRFRFSDVLQPERLTPGHADGYRYWVTGRKSKEGNLTKWQEDYRKILKNGPGKLGEQEARNALKRMTEYNGHSYQNWVLGLSRADPGSTVFFHVYTVAYWRWYNGGTTKSRIFVRGGSCHSSKPRYIEGKKVICQGWKNENEVGDISPTEFARVLAHEIGHSFRLPHPDSTCLRAQTVAGLQLMRQQRAVTIKGGPDCSEQNPYSKFARKLDLSEMIRARYYAKILMARQIAWKKSQREKGLSTNPKRANQPAKVDEEELQSLEQVLGENSFESVQKEEEEAENEQLKVAAADTSMEGAAAESEEDDFYRQQEDEGASDPD